MERTKFAILLVAAPIVILSCWTIVNKLCTSFRNNSQG